ncbi:SMAD/FHA domain-containing protein [Gonapodya prolifera JEL478]|uniref:SMAD/FHA domain-containing protein n=1 Tax=Gonapodya prolifera (strain JEL478) TaxID=1344416 RepID=A0A139ABM0_GONPJ|nr:SMAD/FHA domain-containing protein [Gonapodya prolifera JEL478]|eukprot:KXS14160.1 SMAD/FHA domain-containing protein [Gonapodya prolifera JEL478]
MSDRRRRPSPSDADPERDRKHRRKDGDGDVGGRRERSRSPREGRERLGGDRERERDRDGDRARVKVENDADGRVAGGRRGDRGGRGDARPPPRRGPRTPSASPPRDAKAEVPDVGEGAEGVDTAEGSEQPKEKPNFALSGKLNAEQNTYKGVVLKYSEPPEARKSGVKWRLYVFKDGKETDIFHIHRQSAYLLGRDRLVADIPVDHPSCSKQHAVVQYRLVEGKDGEGKAVKPYIIDLDSANGTHVNGSRIPSSRYVELRQGDVVKFGFSSREYVVMREE